MKSTDGREKNAPLGEREGFLFGLVSEAEFAEDSSCEMPHSLVRHTNEKSSAEDFAGDFVRRHREA